MSKPSRVKVRTSVGRFYPANTRGLLPTYEGFVILEIKDPRRYKRELRRWRQGKR